ncbi:MAG: ABC transporter permease [Eubacteriales bacterium]|nr:ABC transporter permease [Eubacteriales bacterium]
MKRLKLYWKLSWKNFRSYKRLYRPLIIAAGTLLMMFLLLNSIKDIFNLETRQIGLFISFGSIVISVFSLLFISFARRFILRQRGKEMGLYTALGLGKKEFSVIYFFELIYSLLFSLALGLGLSFILGPLFTLAFQRMIELPLSFSWKLSSSRILLGVTVFAVIFVLSFIPELINISRMQAKDIFESGKQSAARVKANPFLALAALLLIGGAYYLAVTIVDPVKASVIFLLAIIMVIIGTYCFYHSLLIVILKFLQKRKSFYHKPQHFIKLSSMLFRLKAHASGLANITILACMILVTLTVTLNFFIVIPAKSDYSIVDNAVSYNYYFDSEESLDDPEALTKLLLQVHAEAEERRTELVPEFSKELKQILNQGQKTDENPSGLELNYISTFRYLPTENYREYVYLATIDSAERLFSKTYSDDRAYLYGVDEGSELEAILEAETGLKIELIEAAAAPRKGLNFNQFSESRYLFIPEQKLESMLRTSVEDRFVPYLNVRFLLGGDLNTQQLQLISDEFSELDHFQKDILPELDGSSKLKYSSASFESEELDRLSFLTTYTLFMFIGVLCGLTFLVGMSVITWFKQFSEAEVERRRIAIMEQIGLSESVIKKSAQSQIYWLLILPLFVAIVHCSFALPFIRKGFNVIGGMSRDNIFTEKLFLSAGIAFASLLIVYYIIYKLSSNAYWRTLKMRNKYDLRGAGQR